MKNGPKDMAHPVDDIPIFFAIVVSNFPIQTEKKYKSLFEKNDSNIYHVLWTNIGLDKHTLSEKTKGYCT